jgi:pSer/pThr/pTyr-binding forkhead associated (FHA) protein
VRLTVLKNNVPINEVQVETPDLHEKYEIFVGRAEDCHVLIDDPLISRHHFILTNDGPNWYCDKLSQLGSVSINGAVAQHALVKNGDEIKCGIYSLMIGDLPSLQSAAPIFTHAPRYEEAAPLERHYAPEPIAPSQAPQSQVEPIYEEEELASLDELPLDMSLEEESVEPLESSEEEFPRSDDFNNEEVVAEELDDEIPDENFEHTNDNAELEDGESSDEKTSFFKAFVNYQLVLFGEHAPYDRFQIDRDEIFIGRDNKKCQIILNDPEVSTVHAVIRKNNVDITLEDLNSSNGTILKGERINRANITAGDEFVIGSTSFTLEVRSDLLDAESGRLMPVESGQVIEHEEIQEEEVDLDDAGDINFDANAPQEKSILKRFFKDPMKRKYLLYAVVLIGGYIFMFVEDTPTNTPAKTAETKKEATPATNAKPKLQLTKELEERRNIAYELGVSAFEQNKYGEAEQQFKIVTEIDPNYKKVQSYLEQTKIALKRLEELETQKRAEEERIKTKKLIEELLVKAREAVKERQIQVAESLFSQIAEKDPENIDIQQLKMELEAWQKEQERIALEKAAREAARKSMVDALQPGKTFYLKKEWYRAILKLEEFLRRKGTDEDLVKEGSDMLSDAKNQLASDLGPLLGKARSLKEGQDLRNAYEAFLEVLKIEPTNAEALNEVDEIRSMLDARSKKIYREAIIAEALSLFNDAKEKFQEVQQISPTDSEYYKKASEKLKNYLE